MHAVYEDYTYGGGQPNSCKRGCIAQVAIADALFTMKVPMRHADSLAFTPHICTGTSLEK